MNYTAGTFQLAHMLALEQLGDIESDLRSAAYEIDSH